MSCCGNIQPVTSYYDIRAVIRYYGELPQEVKIVGNKVCGGMDFSTDWTGVVVSPDRSLTPFPFERWKTPCHEYFANLPLDLSDPGPAYAFTTHYGFLEGSADLMSGRFEVDVVKLMALQELIRKAWANDAEALREIESVIETELVIRGNEIEIAVGDLWSLMRILFLRDRAEGRAKVCANADCPERPYFLQTRKGQKYCRHECAVLVNVRRFRERAKKGKRAKKARRR